MTRAVYMVDRLRRWTFRFADALWRVRERLAERSR